MYKIEKLQKNKYKYVYESESITEIDKIAFRLSIMNIPSRIFQDDILLTFLDGSLYQYNYWRENYVEDNTKVRRIIK